MSRRVRWTSIVVGGGMAFLVASCGGMSQQERQQASDAPRLSGSEISRTIAGNTMSGTMSNNDRWTEYYDADGTIRGLYNGQERYTGAWRVEGDRMCWDYEDDSFDGCNAVGVSGNRVYFFDEDGSVSGTPATLSPGNPSDL